MIRSYVATRVRLMKPKPPGKKTIADKLVEVVGSWKFILSQSAAMVVWVSINLSSPAKWDAYPFILLNLMLSTQAALLGPIILMANNRQSEIDRRRDIDHYLIDVHDSQILEGMALQLEHIHKHVECEDGECHF